MTATRCEAITEYCWQHGLDSDGDIKANMPSTQILAASVAYPVLVTAPPFVQHAHLFFASAAVG
jgi:hypothetical protein